MNKLMSIGIVVLANYGCTNNPYWFEDMPGYKAPILVWRAKTQNEVDFVCRRPVSGCVHRGLDVCLIYLAPTADECTEAHERKHCRGFNHEIWPNFVRDCGVEKEIQK